MTTFVFANNVSTTLAGPISNTATTITLASSANLPSSISGGEYFALTLNDAATRLVYEVVYATAVSGATLTVMRGQEGTTAQAWATGDFAFSGPTAGQMEALQSNENGVSSFNTRTGAVTLESEDVTTALGYTPVAPPVVDSFNTRTGSVVLNATDVDDALDYTPANDAAVVHIAGTETITGVKTINGYLRQNNNSPNDSFANIFGGFPSNGVSIGWSYASAAEVDFHNGWNTAGGGGFAWYAWPSSSARQLMTLSSAGALATIGAITCTTMNATSSDRRLKRDIRKVKARPLHRTVPFVSYTLKESGWQGLGSTAQKMQETAPEHVGEFDWHGKTRLSLNYAGAAYEQAIWAGQEIDRLTKRIAKLERDLARAKIEPRKRGFVRRLLEVIW